MKKKLISIIFIFILLALSAIYSITDKVEFVYNKNIDNSNYTNLGEISGNTTVKQQFLCNRNGLCAVDIKFGTYDRKNSAILNYTIEDIDGNIMANGNIKTADISNNEFYHVKIPIIDNSKGKNYTLTITDNSAMNGNSVTIYTVPDNATNNTVKIIQNSNEKEINDSVIAMKFVTHGFDIETFIIMIFFISFIALFIKILYRFLR